MISKGTNEISNVFKGEQPIEAIYKGTELVWQSFVKGFKKLNFLEANGTQYIPLGISNPSGYRIDIKVAITDTSEDQYIFGSRYSTGSAYLYNVVAFDKNLGFKVRTRATDTTNNIMAVQGQAYDIIGSTLSGNTYISVDGQKSEVFTGSQARSQRVFDLFGMCGHATTAHSSSYMRLYDCKYYSDDGITLEHHYVPALRISDNVAGVYDLVVGEFLTNGGEGEFIYG